MYHDLNITLNMNVMTEYLCQHNMLSLRLRFKWINMYYFAIVINILILIGAVWTLRMNKNLLIDCICSSSIKCYIIHLYFLLGLDPFTWRSSWSLFSADNFPWRHLSKYICMRIESLNWLHAFSLNHIFQQLLWKCLKCKNTKGKFSECSCTKP